jgi:hypothetical protein
MCIQVVERYAACGCLYHRHEIDPCALYGRSDHMVRESPIYVGYACPTHIAAHRQARDSRGYDEGYGSSYSPGSGGYYYSRR